MSDPISSEDRPPTTQPDEDIARLVVTNSQIGNAAQITGSPGSIVNQTHITQLHVTTKSLGLSTTMVLAVVCLSILASVSNTAINLGMSRPFGTLIAGSALAVIVWRLFEKIENLLNDATNHEISAWLLGLKTSDRVQNWPLSFLSLITRIFGERKLSWGSFWRSCFATHTCVAIGTLIGFMSPTARTKAEMMIPAEFNYAVLAISLLFTVPILLVLFTLTNGIPDYISFLKTRVALEWVVRSESSWQRTIIVGIDLIGSLAIAMGSSLFLILLNWAAIHPLSSILPNVPPEYLLSLGPYMALKIKGTFALGVLVQFPMLSYPAFFGTIWFMLYASSGFLLKAAKRFDIGFRWFNRKFDIERKPLSAIGFVAGVLVATVYWAVVIGCQIWS